MWRPNLGGLKEKLPQVDYEKHKRSISLVALGLLILIVAMISRLKGASDPEQVYAEYQSAAESLGLPQVPVHNLQAMTNAMWESACPVVDLNNISYANVVGRNGEPLQLVRYSTDPYTSHSVLPADIALFVPEYGVDANGLETMSLTRSTDYTLESLAGSSGTFLTDEFFEQNGLTFRKVMSYYFPTALTPESAQASLNDPELYGAAVQENWFCALPE